MRSFRSSSSLHALSAATERESSKTLPFDTRTPPKSFAVRIFSFFSFREFDNCHSIENVDPRVLSLLLIIPKVPAAKDRLRERKMGKESSKSETSTQNKAGRSSKRINLEFTGLAVSGPRALTRGKGGWTKMEWRLASSQCRVLSLFLSKR